MKKILTYCLLLFVAIIFSNCDKEEVSDPFPSELVEGCYIINYGNFGAGGASISKYDYNIGEMFNFYYQAQNGGTELLSNIQYAVSSKDSIYLIGNAVDQLITLNPLFKQNRNGLTDVLDNPRYCVAYGKYLYVSCWGLHPDYVDMPGSYIAKYNTASNEVEEYFDVPGGPEGMAIAKGKLFIALNYINEIAVLNLSNNELSSIITPAVSSYFVLDKTDNLYVSFVSTWSDPSAEAGLGYINTTNATLETTYKLKGVNSAYGSMIQMNSDKSKIYIATEGENWGDPGAVSVFNVESKSFVTTPFIDQIAGLSGLTVNPVNGDVYIFTATNVTSAGKMKIYSETGDFIQEHSVGASPIGAFFLD